ncbi:MAG: efflux RND transporter periplasmic adaptor subunit [Gemmatimonadota bacterium]|nr:efflux RND transporter periplasmic adaptor subunit [Gemmatimonadota bacterium]
MDIPRKPTRSRRRWFIGGAALAVGTLLTVALARLEPAAPTVERATVWMDTVERGTMLRQVRGPGTLVAEDIRWVSSVNPGRVEQRLVQPGTLVEAGTLLLELSNPDVNRQALEGERQLAGAVAGLASLQATLENQRLTQEATVATVRAEHREATRQAAANEKLAAQDLVATTDVERSRDRAEELKARLAIEQQRLRYVAESARSQIAAQQAQVNMLRGLVDFSRRQVEAMKIRAPSDGVLQDLPVEVGQWVQPGATLARVVRPGLLKAVLRIPETQAKDIAVGQVASIDTRNGIVRGQVMRIDPAVQNGTVTVDVRLEGELPKGARPDLSVDGTIDIERLENVMYVGRPAYGQAESTVGMFRVAPDRSSAVRVPVRLGRSSASTIEVVGGLQPGDVVILSDMSQWDSSERVRLQ